MTENRRPSPEDKTGRSLFRHLLSLTGGILGSRIFGLLRDIICAGFWGATGTAQAAFSTAFAIPNSLRQLCGEGAFSAAFVPIFTSRLSASDDKAPAWKLAEAAISVQAVILTALVLLVSLVSAALYLLEPWQSAPHVRQVYLILPLLMPYAVLICVAASFAAILNSLSHFAVPSLVPVIFNVVQVAAIGYIALFWDNTSTTALLIFCASTLLAGLLQLLALMLCARRQGFRFHFHPDWHHQDVVLLGKKMLPGIVGAGVMQINSLADKFIGAYLGQEAVGSLNYSSHLLNLPIGLFGTALATVCLPALSRAWVKHDDTAIQETLDSSFRFILFLTIPAAAGMMLLSPLLVRTLFQRGAFTAQATLQVAAVLSCYLTGLPAYCGVKIAASAFHSRQDTRTPVQISCLCLILNIFLNLLLMQFFRQRGLALATSLCSWLNLTLLLTLNRKHLPQWTPCKLLPELLRLAAATLLMAAVLRWLPLSRSLPETMGGSVASLLAGLACAGSLFLCGAWLFRSQALREIAGNLRARKTTR